MADFDNKVFNPEVFDSLVRSVPNTEKNALLRAGVFTADSAVIASKFADQFGGNFASVPYKAPLATDATNYDGETDIADHTSDTYQQDIIVVGRANSYLERDFSHELNGYDWLASDYALIAGDKDHNNSAVLTSALKGIFANADFAKSNLKTGLSLGVGTIIDATRGIAGDNSSIFRVVIMHSAVASVLEKANLLDYLKYTDANGVERMTDIQEWNGRIVLVDDSVPAVAGSDGKTVYTTYLLGLNAITYQPLTVRVPYEISRNAKVHGGETSLIWRERHALGFAGFSFTKASLAKNSPTNAELADKTNWKLMTSASGVKYPTKLIPIAGFTTEL